MDLARRRAGSKVGTFAAVAVALCLSAFTTSARAADEPLRPDTDATDLLRRGRYAAAVTAAERELWRAPGDPWPYYDRGVALSRLGRTEEAARSFQDAERRFGPNARWGKSVAAYAQANVLDQAGQCADAAIAYERYATLVEADHPALAARARDYAGRCRARPDDDPGQTVMTSLLIAGQYAEALLVPVRDPDSALHAYGRGVALTGLARTNEAVEAFEEAENRFGGNVWGQSIATWGAARALDLAGRCFEARRPYERYATLVAPTDPDGARLALARAHGCSVKPPAFVAAREVVPSAPVAAR